MAVMHRRGAPRQTHAPERDPQCIETGHGDGDGLAMLRIDGFPAAAVVSARAVRAGAAVALETSRGGIGHRTALPDAVPIQT